MADEIMVDAVKKVLLKTFTKDHGTTDVQTLAAERIATILLEDGFKELKKYSIKAEQEIKELNNVGL